MYALNRLFLLRALIDLAMCNRQRSEREECGKENERKKPKRALKISLNKLSVMLQSWERKGIRDMIYDIITKENTLELFRLILIIYSFRLLL